mmetsp:Transcript_35898/g.103268  ORF Transcript_35898/g.103268 Transcript_35898/m.103268 type:complete len:269 (+) Transcript_35898:482-1288(+)
MDGGLPLILGDVVEPLGGGAPLRARMALAGIRSDAPLALEAGGCSWLGDRRVELAAEVSPATRRGACSAPLPWPGGPLRRGLRFRGGPPTEPPVPLAARAPPVRALARAPAALAGLPIRGWRGDVSLLSAALRAVIQGLEADPAPCCCEGELGRGPRGAYNGGVVVGGAAPDRVAPNGARAEVAPPLASDDLPEGGPLRGDEVAAPCEAVSTATRSVLGDCDRRLPTDEFDWIDADRRTPVPLGPEYCLHAWSRPGAPGTQPVPPSLP